VFCSLLSPFLCANLSISTSTSHSLPRNSSHSRGQNVSLNETNPSASFLRNFRKHFLEDSFRVCIIHESASFQLLSMSFYGFGIEVLAIPIGVNASLRVSNGPVDIFVLFAIFVDPSQRVGCRFTTRSRWRSSIHAKKGQSRFGRLQELFECEGRRLSELRPQFVKLGSGPLLMLSKVNKFTIYFSNGCCCRWTGRHGLFCTEYYYLRRSR
jgi:hypothetical protein